MYCTPGHRSLGQVGEDPLVAGVGHRVEHALRPAPGGRRSSRRPASTPGGVQVAPKYPVTTSSGRCRRIAPAMSRRSSGPATRTPSRWSRNSTSVTPTTAAERRSSSSRSGPASSGRTPGHPGLAAGGQQVVHVLAGRRPGRRRRRPCRTRCRRGAPRRRGRADQSSGNGVSGMPRQSAAQRAATASSTRASSAGRADHRVVPGGELHHLPAGLLAHQPAARGRWSPAAGRCSRRTSAAGPPTARRRSAAGRRRRRRAAGSGAGPPSRGRRPRARRPPAGAAAGARAARSPPAVALHLGGLRVDQQSPGSGTTAST